MKATEMMERLRDVSRLIGLVCEDLLINDMERHKAEEANDIVDELMCEIEEVEG